MMDETQLEFLCMFLLLRVVRVSEWGECRENEESVQRPNKWAASVCTLHTLFPSELDCKSASNYNFDTGCLSQVLCGARVGMFISALYGVSVFCELLYKF